GSGARRVEADVRLSASHHRQLIAELVGRMACASRQPDRDWAGSLVFGPQGNARPLSQELAGAAARLTPAQPPDRKRNRRSMSDLHDLQNSMAFYEARYQQGYMEDYSPEAKQRIFDVIRALDLPREGAALDFGCGNGVLTDIIRQALPNWKI